MPKLLSTNAYSEASLIHNIHLSGIFIYPNTCSGTDHSYIHVYRKWLTQGLWIFSEPKYQTSLFQNTCIYFFQTMSEIENSFQSNLRTENFVSTTLVYNWHFLFYNIAFATLYVDWYTHTKCTSP